MSRAPEVTPVVMSRSPEPASPSRARSIEPTPARSASTTQTEVVGLGSLPLEVQEQLFGVLKATLDATLHPVLSKQAELESRLEVLREAEERAAVATAARLAAPRRSVAPAGEVKPSQTQGAVPEPKVSAAPAVRASMVSTSYGLVMEQPGGAKRPAIEEAVANLGPIDVPDFGASRRAAGRILVAVLLAGVAAAVAATILSYT